MKKFLNWIQHIIQITSWRSELTQQMNETVGRLFQNDDELSQAIGQSQQKLIEEHDRIDWLKDNVSDLVFDSILNDQSKLKKLNRTLSITPTIWGDEARIHISPKASVYTAFFNTNSGDITIGDYSFTGSNVSFLTGSHDTQLTGLLRRDCEMKNTGDIIIGNGVWIASNAVVIGPCTIGDNSVVAAGAVVTPGTIIPANTVYAGVPARKIKELDLKGDITMENKAIADALEREQGILFADGWSEKSYIKIKDVLYTGHWMIEEKALILTSLKAKRFYYELENDKTSMNLTIDNKRYELKGHRGSIEVNCREKMLLSKERCEDKVFIGYESEE